MTRSRCRGGASGRDPETRRWAGGLEKGEKQEMGNRKRQRGRGKRRRHACPGDAACAGDAAWLATGARAGERGVAELLSKQDVGCEMGVKSLSGGNWARRAGLGRGREQGSGIRQRCFPCERYLPLRSDRNTPSVLCTKPQRESEMAPWARTGPLASVLPPGGRPAGLPNRAWGWLGCAPP